MVSISDEIASALAIAALVGLQADCLSPGAAAMRRAAVSALEVPPSSGDQDQ